MRGALGDDDNAGDHQDKGDDFAGDPGGRAIELLLQPQGGQGDGDQRIADGNDGQHRRDQGALLEGVLVEQEAQRADHRQSVDRPVAQHGGQAAADVGDDQLDQESRDAVVDAAGQRQGQRPQALVPGGDGQAAHDRGGQPGGERQHDVEAHGGLAAGRPRDGEEAGDANCGGDHPAQQHPVPALAQEGVDQDSEDQVTDQERLDQG